MTCVYCEKPLECDACGDLYDPPGLAEYQALSRPEVPVYCTGCGAILVCHWCKMPYDLVADQCRILSDLSSIIRKWHNWL